jgi:hypothetical protein
LRLWSNVFDPVSSAHDWFPQDCADALSRIALGNLLLIAIAILRHPSTAGKFGKYLLNAGLAVLIASGYRRGFCGCRRG